MNFPDPKWLDLLKASGWQTASLAVACGLFLLAGHIGWLPPLSPWMIQLATFSLFLFGCLAVTSVIAAFLEAPAFQDLIIHWVVLRRERHAVRDYIPHMTEHERAIIAYLLAKNQKVFTTNSDGGWAATLMARGIVIRASPPGQPYGFAEMPVEIPDHIWKVLTAHKSQFPYAPPPPGEIETHPWRVPWMAR